MDYARELSFMRDKGTHYLRLFGEAKDRSMDERELENLQRDRDKLCRIYEESTIEDQQTECRVFLGIINGIIERHGRHSEKEAEA